MLPYSAAPLHYMRRLWENHGPCHPSQIRTPRLIEECGDDCRRSILTWWAKTGEKVSSRWPCGGNGSAAHQQGVFPCSQRALMLSMRAPHCYDGDCWFNRDRNVRRRRQAGAGVKRREAREHIVAQMIRESREEIRSGCWQSGGRMAATRGWGCW